MQPANANAFALAWNFFKGNYALNFAALAILIVMNILGMVPILGVLFIFAYSVLSFAIQIYFGKKMEGVHAPEDMANVAAQTKIRDLFMEYVDVAAGAFLAFLMLGIVFGLLFAIVAGVGAGMMQESVQMQSMGMRGEEQMAMMVASGMGIGGFLLLLVMLFLAYFFPAVMGRVILSDDFVSGFKNAFLIFSPALWKSCFNKDYFLLILLWSIIIFVALLVIFALSATLILLPLGVVIAYILALYNAAIYVFAAKLAQE